MNIQVYNQIGAKKYFYEQQPKDLLGKLIPAQSLLSDKEVNNKTFWRLKCIESTMELRTDFLRLKNAGES
jgi:hypothetical protein